MERIGTGRLFRFGVYEAVEVSGELRKQGRRLRLQGQPFQVLLMLLERPGEVVTREEIRQRLWPDGTFVDFDHGLNTAINKLRDCLGESASNPRFVETLAKRGYRFIAPVEVADNGGTPTASEVNQPSEPFPSPEPLPTQEPLPSPEALPSPEPLDAATASTAAFSQFLTQPHQLPQPSHGIVRKLFFLVQLMYLSFYLISLARLGEVGHLLADLPRHGWWIMVVLIVTAVVAIPARLYLMTAVLFKAPGLRENFLKLFPFLFPVDQLWALAPFLLLPQIGVGLALGVTAALLYVPFAQRSLILMGAGISRRT
jgi:DNA-binding winged helix-turn-helix (wHTH) protein